MQIGYIVVGCIQIKGQLFLFIAYAPIWLHNIWALITCCFVTLIYGPWSLHWAWAGHKWAQPILIILSKIKIKKDKSVYEDAWNLNICNLIFESQLPISERWMIEQISRDNIIYVVTRIIFRPLSTV